MIGSFDYEAINASLKKLIIGSRDGRGTVLFHDNFDFPLAGVGPEVGGLGWVYAGVVGGSIARNVAYKARGIGCLGVTTAGVAGVGGISRAWRTIPLPSRGSRRIGLEVYMAGQRPATENFGYFNFGFRYNSRKNKVYDGPFICAGGSLGAAHYVNSVGSYIKIPELGATVDTEVFTSNVIWHYAKLVCDLDKHEYVRLIWDGVEKDLSGIRVGSLGAPSLYDTLIVQLASVNASLALACLTLYDECVVTNDE